jgi:hypothetical protein
MSDKTPGTPPAPAPGNREQPHDNKREHGAARKPAPHPAPASLYIATPGMLAAGPRY